MRILVSTCFLLLVLFANPVHVFGQVAYYDALELSTYLDKDGKLITDDFTLPNGSILKVDNLYGILKVYLPANHGIPDPLTNEKIQKYYFKNNSFISPFISDTSLPLVALAGGAPGTIISKALTSVGGIDVTNLTQATADFLIKRVKDELVLEFFERFRDDLDKAPELKHLFPRTYNLLLTIDDLRVPTMGQTWKSAFQEDLKNMLYNFEDMVNQLDNYKELRNTQAFLIFMIAATSLDMHTKRLHPVDIFTRIDVKYGNENDAIKQDVRLLNLLSKNLRSQKNESWIKYEEFRNITSVQMQLFIGLLYEQNKSLFNNIQVPVADNSQPLTDFLMVNNFSNIKNFVSYQQDLVLLFNNVDERIKTIKNLYTNPSENKTKIIDEYIASLDILIDIIDYGISLKYFSEPDKFYESDYFKKHRPIAVYSADAIEAVNSKNYGLTVISTINAISPLLDIRLHKLQEAATKPDATPADVDKFVRFKRAKDKVSFYGSFMVDIINADSSAAIEAALNRYALPVGSYRLKRRSNFSIDLNAFPGLYGSSEWTRVPKMLNGSPQLDNNGNVMKESKPGFAYGITAPIGFAFNWGIHKKDKDIDMADQRVIKIKKNKSAEFNKKTFRGSSFSVYVPIVDIGAAVSYRATTDTAKGLPDKIKLGQILSPGIYGILGIKNTPFSIMVGTQYTPLLRKIDEANDLSGNAWRVGATLAVDIPIFNLFHREPTLTIK